MQKFIKTRKIPNKSKNKFLKISQKIQEIPWYFENAKNLVQVPVVFQLTSICYLLPSLNKVIIVY